MPILGSRGAASVKGFGFAALSSPTYWLATYFANNSGGGIAIDSAGNAYVVGRETAGSAVDGVLARVTKKGVQIWQRQYAIGGSFVAEFNDVAVNSTSGNIYVIGNIDYPSSNTDILIVKYNSSGTIQWERTLDGAATTETPYRIALDSSENVYITGITPTNLLLVAKYDSSGTIQWQRSLTNVTFFQGIAVNSSGDSVYVSGTTQPFGTRIFFAKFPGDGSDTGTYTLNGYNYTYAVSSLTDAATSLTDAAGSLTDAAGSLTGGTPTTTGSAGTMNYALTSL